MVFTENSQDRKEVIFLYGTASQDSASIVQGIRSKLEASETNQGGIAPTNLSAKFREVILHVVFFGETPEQDLIFVDIMNKSSYGDKGKLLKDFHIEDPIRVRLENGDLERYRQDKAVSHQVSGKNTTSFLKKGSAIAAFRQGRHVSLEDIDLNLTVEIERFEPVIPKLMCVKARDYNLPWEKKKSGRSKTRRRKKS